MIMLNDALQLVLSFYRSPERSTGLTDPSKLLPEGVAGVLQLVADGEPARLRAESGALTEISPEELHKMMSFFAEKLFFLPGANHYRVLGLNPGASSAHIRNHYKLLLHLFYLDRNDRSSEWNTECAIHINQAYSILRDQERRCAYDQDLRGQGFVFVESKDHGEKQGGGDVKSTASNFVRLQPISSSLSADITPKDGGLAGQKSESGGEKEPHMSQKGDDELAPSAGGASNAPFVSNSAARVSSGGGDQGRGRDISSKSRRNQLEGDALMADRHDLVGAQNTRLVVEADESPGAMSEAHQAPPFWKRYSATLGAGVILVLFVGIGAAIYGTKAPPPAVGVSESVSNPVSADSGLTGVVNEGAQRDDTAEPLVVDENVEQVVEITAPASLQTASIEKAVTEMQSIGFEFTSDSWVEVIDARDEKLFLNIGKAGDSRTVKGVAPFNILLGNARGVVMKVNGQPYDHYVHIRKGVARFILGGQPLVLANNGENSSLLQQEISHSPEHANDSEDVLPKQNESSDMPESVAVLAESPVESVAAAAVLSEVSPLQDIVDDISQEAALSDSLDQPASIESSGTRGMEGSIQIQSKAMANAIVLTADLPTGNMKGGLDETDLTSVASTVPVVENKLKSTISLLELDDLVFDFMRTYEIGDLDSFIRLFSKQAHTNDRSDREGIEKDYRELFQITEKRQFIISKLRWDRGLNTARGEGDFRVNIQLKSNHRLSSYVGKVVLHVKKAGRRVLITQLVHEYEDVNNEE